jgi:hypothetical protein
MNMRASTRWGTLAAILGVLVSSVSCGDVARQGRAPVLVVIDSLEAASGANPGNLGGFLLSDVQTLVDQTVNGETVRVPVIFNDVAQATLRLIMKDQGTGGAGTSPTVLNAVTLSRYRIKFMRADGRNAPGVDVPFPVDGAVTATLNGTATTVVPFEMVRHQAKLEQPLRSLVTANGNFGGRIFISTIAEVTFYGADQAGNDVQATGTISVSFGDYADPE